MRKFSKRPDLDAKTAAKLEEKQQEIIGIADIDARRLRARQVYNAARGAKWFAPVVTALRQICGECDVCMYCSANEPSQVEHYRPLDVYPEHALAYANYLWSCDICNRSFKGSRFPPDTEAGATILNPLDDYVWDYFLLDERFGRLVKRVDPITAQELPRAISTCDVVGIDRDSIQQRRKKRLNMLRREVEFSHGELKAGTITQAEAQERIASWLADPFQADVADYFLAGPGREKDPFKTYISAAYA